MIDSKKQRLIQLRTLVSRLAEEMKRAERRYFRAAGEFGRVAREYRAYAAELEALRDAAQNDERPRSPGAK